jgi:hypothetical protein
MRHPLIAPALVKENWPLVSLILFSFFRSLLGHETGVNPEAAEAADRAGSGRQGVLLLFYPNPLDKPVQD